MSKIKLYIGVNVLSNVSKAVYANHKQLYYLLGKSGKYELIDHVQPRTSIDRMRNECAKNALRHEADYLLFVDDDMLLQDNTIDSLIEADQDIVMAHTYIRGYPFHPMSFKLIGDEEGMQTLTYYDDVLERVTPENRGIIPCQAVGFATCLIKMHLFKQLQPPFFVTTPTGTEDVWFCLKCKKEIGEHVTVSVDTRVPVGHLLDPEPVCTETVQGLKRYYEDIWKESFQDKRADRGQEYLDKLSKLG